MLFSAGFIVMGRQKPRLVQPRNEEKLCDVGAFQCLETENNNQQQVGLKFILIICRLFKIEEMESSLEQLTRYLKCKFLEI